MSKANSDHLLILAEFMNQEIGSEVIVIRLSCYGRGTKEYSYPRDRSLDYPRIAKQQMIDSVRLFVGQGHRNMEMIDLIDSRGMLNFYVRLGSTIFQADR